MKEKDGKKILIELIKAKGDCDNINSCFHCPLNTWKDNRVYQWDCISDDYASKTSVSDIFSYLYKIGLNKFIEKYGEDNLVKELL